MKNAGSLRNICHCFRGSTNAVFGNFRKLKPDLFVEWKASSFTISAASFAFWIKINLLLEREMFDDKTSSSF